LADERLHPLRAGRQALAHGLITEGVATARADPRNLPYRQIGTAIEQDQVQEVLGRLNHAGPLEGLILARQVRALGRQLLTELRILASNLLKWHGSLLSSLDSRRETFCHFFQHFTSYLGAYGVAPPVNLRMPLWGFGAVASGRSSFFRQPLRVSGS